LPARTIQHRIGPSLITPAAHVFAGRIGVSWLPQVLEASLNREVAMTAYNVVRFRVKPGREKDFENANRNAEREFTGLRKIALIKTAERAYCFIGEWESMDSIVAARPEMIEVLDGFRQMLEDLGGGLGVTDPVSGEAVVEIGGN
jgi:hypothetical protein